jgi:hypothetical protein
MSIKGKTDRQHPWRETNLGVAYTMLLPLLLLLLLMMMGEARIS